MSIAVVVKVSMHVGGAHCVIHWLIGVERKELRCAVHDVSIAKTG